MWTSACQEDNLIFAACIFLHLFVFNFDYLLTYQIASQKKRQKTSIIISQF